MEVLPRNWVGGCVTCSKPFEGEYWLAGGQPVCHDCARDLSADSQAPPKPLLIRAILFATAAAILLAAISATIQIFAGFEIVYLALPIAWLIGKAIGHATKGLGGNQAQIIAVSATYLSLTLTVFIQILYQFSAAGKDFHGLLGILFLFGLALGKPFLEAPTGLDGMIGFLIFSLALFLAWYETRQKPIRLSGPFITTP
jgi:hypothetical protein